MLLLAGTVQPQGSSNLTSLRFSGPVRIRKIRIYPKGAALFAQNSAAVTSQTEPETFPLSLFLNAQAAPTSQEPKPKATNVLVPTSLVYPGGLRDFIVDMGPEFVTRLIIIRGDFTSVTLAVYGDSVDVTAEPTIYEPTPIPTLERSNIFPPFNLAEALDPTVLARELLLLVPSSPSMNLVLRLMLCLKPQDDAWGTIQFSNLEDCAHASRADTGLNWLQTAADALMLPISDDVDQLLIAKFIDNMVYSLTDKTNDHLYAYAGLLRRASAQPSTLIRHMLKSLDLAEILEPSLLDKHIIERFHDAAANPLVAEALNAPSILKNIETFRHAHANNNAVQTATIALQDRILGWEKFVKVISGQSTDISGLLSWLKELESDDMTCGVFLYSIISGDMLVHIQALPVGQTSSLLSLWTNSTLPSFSEFVAFLRASIGIPLCLATFCWAEDTLAWTCSERLLALVRLWQETDGYREIVNCALLLRRVLYRLENVLRQEQSVSCLSVVYVERILCCLCSQPESTTRAELASLVAALPVYTSTLSESEIISMQEVVSISKYGLPQAIVSVMTWSEQQPSDCCPLQTALLIIASALEDRDHGEWTVLQASWQEGFHGLVYQLIELLPYLLQPIKKQFSLTIPPSLHSNSLIRLLLSSSLVIKILSRLIPSSPLPDRCVRLLVHGIMNLFIVTDAIDTAYSQISVINQMTRNLRPSCADILLVVCGTNEDSAIGQLVLKTLLHTAVCPENDDPTLRLEQGFYLLDLLLPLTISEDRSKEWYWTKKVIPAVLPELLRFHQGLTMDNRVQLVQRLAGLDRNEVGLGVWFVDEELKLLFTALDGWQDPHLPSGTQDILQARITDSIGFLARLLKETSGDVLTGSILESSVLLNLSRLFGILSHSRYIFQVLSDLVLASCTSFGSLLHGQAQIDLAIILLRSQDYQPSCLISASELIVLVGSPSEEDILRVLAELGPMFHRLIEGDLASDWHRNKSLPRAFVSIILWLLKQPLPEIFPLRGITKSSFMTLIPHLSPALSNEISFLSDVQTRFSFTQELHDQPLLSVRHEPLVVSFDNLTSLLTIRPTSPPTPKLNGESIFKMATTSPITALVGSSRISTLTKTYQKDEFRQLSARQNTSRRPSVHVDAFQNEFAEVPYPATPAMPGVSAPTPSNELIQLLPPMKFE